MKNATHRSFTDPEAAARENGHYGAMKCPLREDSVLWITCGKVPHLRPIL
jgi:hypothetical protein